MLLRERRPTAIGTWGFEEGDEIAPGLTALRLLGTSRTHDVYLAFDRTRLTVVVAKLIRRDRLDDAGARSALAREGRLLASLHHPALPRCFEDSTDGERPHLRLELVEGPRLSTLIRRQGLLGPEQLLPVAQQLCAAVHYLHGHGLVHLDVKPKNVVMAPSPKLIDLSVATSVERARTLRGPIGTDAYMAPEQCGVEGRGEIGPPADVWGIGATLYEAATGSLPFGRGSADGVASERFPQLIGTPPPLPREVPSGVAGAVMAALAPRPQDRPTAAEVASSIDEDFERLPRRLLLGRARVSWGRRS
jgi:serine/threonine protein kinase